MPDWVEGYLKGPVVTGTDGSPIFCRLQDQANRAQESEGRCERGSSTECWVSVAFVGPSYSEQSLIVREIQHIPSDLHRAAFAGLILAVEGSEDGRLQVYACRAQLREGE